MTNKTNDDTPIFHVFGGGTVNHVRSHFSLAATAYGGTARKMHDIFTKRGINSQAHLTKMACAGQSQLETNDDIGQRLDEVLENPNSAAIIFNVAVTDFVGQIGDIPSGKYAERMSSREAEDLKVELKMADKLVPRIKERRPDIVLVAFKTTTHMPRAVQIERGNGLLNGSGADIILANDTGTRNNIIMAQGGDVISENTDRNAIIELLADSVVKLSAERNAPAPKL